MIFSIFYEIIQWFLAFFYLPKFAYDTIFRKKYRQSLLFRLGYDFPLIDKGKRPLIWVHAVSVGETKAVSSFIKLLRQKLQDPLIIISNATETGHAEAKRSISCADHHVYMPFDLRCIVKPIVKRIAPDLVILSETDLWYNFLQEAQKAGAHIFLVNGKLSDRSFNRFKKIPFFTKKLFAFFNLICVQSSHYYQRFEALGIQKDKLKVTGNLKFDDEYSYLDQGQKEIWKKQFQLSDNAKAVVVGSTHDPEENLILEQFQGVWKEFPNTRLIIVPRHPERFDDVALLLEKKNIPFQRFSEPGKQVNAKVILVDTMGVLRQCYQLADVAIVAGSFVSHVGGHNILEPSSYGVPVLYGPYMHSQPELMELMQKFQAGKQVEMINLGSTLLELLKDGDKRSHLGKNGLHMFKSTSGATQKTWESIAKILSYDIKDCGKISCLL